MSSFIVDSIEYTVIDGTLNVSATGYSGTASGSLLIPNTVSNNGIIYSVISIGNNAFANLTGFTSLTLSNNLTSIGNGAFLNCSGFTGTLTIPNSVTTISSLAFDSCYGFTGSLTIPNSVTSIERFAFQSCSGFDGQLTLSTNLTSIAANAFSNCSGFSGSLTIPNLVTIIEAFAFRNCSGFTGSLTIPNLVTSIEGYAFAGCAGFTGSLTISNSVTSIGTSAFIGCTGFTSSLTIPSSVTSIGDSAFAYCPNFTNVIIDNQNSCTVETTSFTNVSTTSGSVIKFYLTQNASSLTSNWSTISTYYARKIYDNNPSCFNEGTKILCLNKNLEEEYIPVENLRKGDLVKSYKHGYRKIDLIGKNIMINNPDLFHQCMYKMNKSETNGLIEDLIVTGGHAILVDNLNEYCKKMNEKNFGGKTPLIDDKYLLLSAVSKDFTKMENTNQYTYYHFILQNNGNNHERFGVWANGVLTETPSKKQFMAHRYILI
jgi:hypothetical protein